MVDIAWWKPVLWLAVFGCAAMIANGILISIVIVVVALIFVRSTRAPTLAFISRSWLWSVGIGVSTGLALAFIGDPLVNQFSSWVTGSQIDLSSLEGVHGNLANYLTLLAVGILFGGVLEEIVNRGFIVGWGSSVLGERFALPLVFASAIGFGLAHAWQGPAGMIATVFSGLVFGLVYYLCDRKLLPAMLAHATSNFVGITQIYLYGVG